MKSPKDYYTPQEIADILHTSAQMVRVSLLNACKGWDFPFIKCGNRIKIPKKTFDEWRVKTYG